MWVRWFIGGNIDNTAPAYYQEHRQNNYCVVVVVVAGGKAFPGREKSIKSIKTLLSPPPHCFRSAAKMDCRETALTRTPPSSGDEHYKLWPSGQRCSVDFRSVQLHYMRWFRFR